ncbi:MULTISPECIES: alpha-E domain-containing protein [Acinetobacter]|uniref:Alpha-E domain-containing protein n=1 Tax=Acinetobacter geminorum TaxID=2730922 RepID=A0ABT8Z8N5_9GAMM|nr:MULTISPECIES: alpha-E domain-containing protein [Acinetobacter]MBJ8432726.1 alpha-E domain-containing protein [Acinetobacter pittii]MCU4360208.1 alpha-E domain-containing protein [Acinetobacter sp. WU_MDCI_Abxc22]MCU4563164.1 alpha-E domain-containing protein [Acinetobacter sp. WU_MDCI_Abxc222]MDO7361092.1 alpha-E domain-containing protein [Acinetobacter geminorum]MEB7639976.1 alpha-E domain-containing protein [Acinetobacter pittii]
MVLLNSSAHQIYWLGRYLMRVKFAASHLPFTEDEKATKFAAAFGLVIENAELLNHYMLDKKQTFSLLNQLIIAKDNIQELRGILSSHAYAELNNVINTLQPQPDALSKAVEQCTQILEAEHEDVRLFLHLGQKIEQFDIELRFGEDLSVLVLELDLVVQQLANLNWENIDENWQVLKQQLTWDAYYTFTQQLENMFEG